MKSMTGYGKGEMSIDGKSVTVELKSVNHRFLDLSLKMPSVFSFAEDIIRNELKYFHRGHIDVYLSYNAFGDKNKEYEVDFAQAESYITYAEELSKRTGIVNDLKVSDIFSLPQVIVEKKDDCNNEDVKLLLQVALSSAIQALDEMRINEGNNLKKVLSNHLEVIAELAECVKLRAPIVVEEYREKLKSRMESYLKELEPDETRLLNEVAFFTDKANVDEEINRLFSHIDQFEKLLDSQEPQGKKLDFLLQEMNRETNTIGSKANDTILLNYVVSLKNELEKLREQVQNVE